MDKCWCLAPLCFFSVAKVAFALEPVSFTQGPVQVIPQVSLQAGYDDNIYSTASGEVESWKSIISPALQLKMVQGKSEYTLNYQLHQGIYQESSDDNYTDHQLDGRVFLDLNSRNRLELVAGYLAGHEGRGTGLNQGTAALTNNKPVEYHVNSLFSAYEYGGQEAKGRIRLAATYQDREYDNYRSQTQVKDRENVKMIGTFFYRVLPKTSLLFELSNEDIDYRLSSVNLDSTERKYLLGATWDATAKTSGTVKLGYSDKDFDSSAREDGDGSSWEVAMRWAPRSYSVFDISTNRGTRETDGTGDYIDSTDFNLQWTHAWSGVWRSRVYLNLSNDDYAKSAREDDGRTVGLGLDFFTTRWLNLALDYRYSERDSNQSDLNFERNAIYLTIQMSL